MPRGIYPRKKRVKAGTHNLPAVIPPSMEAFPLDAIPDVTRSVPRQGPQRVSIEPALVGLCHRMLDQQQTLLDMLKPQPRKQYKKRKKGKVKA